MLTLVTTLIAAQLVALADGGSIADPSLIPVERVPSAVEVEAPRARSVYRVHLAVDIPVTVAGGVIAAVRLIGTPKLVHPSCPCDPATLNPLDRSTVYFNSRPLQVVADVSLAIIVATPILLDLLDLGFTRPFFEDLMIFVETLAVDTGFQAGTALIVQRPRPLSYAGEPDLISRGEGYTSFYAGHVATAFAALSVVSQTLRLRYGMRVWPWFLTAVLGTAMALERVGSGDHFPTDVIAGAVAGLAIGITVPWLHERAPEAHVRLIPSHAGLGLAGEF